MKKTLRLISVLLLVALVGMCLVACTPKDLDAAKTKMENAEYITAKMATDYSGEEGYVGSFVANRGLPVVNDNYGFVTAILFESGSAAKSFYNKLKGEDSKTFEGITLSGKWVVWGNEQGIKDFTK